MVVLIGEKVKKTYFVDLIKTIKVTKISFISILIFVTLGIGIFLGFSWTDEGLGDSTNAFIEKYNLHDVDVFFPYGFSEEDVENVRSVEGVSKAQGRLSAYNFFTIDGDNYQARITQITNEIDRLCLVEGRLPNAMGEIAVDKSFLSKHSLKLGDHIQFNSDRNGSTISPSKIMSFDPTRDDVADFFDDEDIDTLKPSERMVYLNTDDFVITGVVVSPEYACTDPVVYGVSASNGISIDAGLYVDKASFKEDAFLGYTEILVLGDDHIRNLNYSHDDYKEKAVSLENRVELAIRPSALKKKAEIIVKKEEIKKAVDKKLDEEGKKIEDNKRKLADGEEDLEDGREKIADAKDKIAKGKLDIEEGKDKLAEGEDSLEEARGQLEDAKRKLNDGKKKLDDGINEYNEKYQEWLDGFNDLENGKKKYADSKSLYDYSRCQYDGAMKDYHIAEEIINDFEVMHRGISEGKVTFDNFEAVLNEWQCASKLAQLGEIASKYDTRGEKLIEAAGEISYGIEQLKKLTDASLFDSALEALNETILSELIDDSRDYLGEFNNRLKENETALNKALDELHDAEAEINRGEAKLIYHKGELDDAKAEIDSNQKKYDDAERKYNKGLNEYNKKQSEYDDANDLIAEKEQEIADSEREIIDNEEKIEDGSRKLIDLREKLDKAIEEYNEKNVLINSQIDKMDTVNVGNTYALTTRSSLVFLNSIKVMSDIIKKLRYSLAGLFVIVGLFVCYSAVIRMVYSQMTLIGVKKSLGFRDSEVKIFYLLYTASAVIIGCILGSILGYIVEHVVLKAFSNNYWYDEYFEYFGVFDLILVSLIQMGALILITYVAAKEIMSKRAIELLQGGETSSGKSRFYEKWSAFKKLNFYYKIIINNCVSDKRRVIGTIIGITGCTALIVTSLTFNRDTLRSFDKNFKDYCKFNYIVYFDNTMDTTSELISDVVKNYTDNYAMCGYEYALVEEPAGVKSLLNIYIPDDYNDFAKIYNVTPKENLSNEDVSKGVWMDYAYRNYYGEDAYPDIKLLTMTGNAIKVKVDGFMHYYLTTGMMIMSKQKYEQFYDKSLKPNAALLMVDDDNADKLKKQLNDVEGFIKISNYYASSQRTFKVFSALTYVIVIVYVLLSIVMSVLVLLNLLNQFIDEKKKELIVMLINGFEYKDVKKYIYLDTIVLTTIGVILGTVLGSVLGSATMRNFDSAMVYFLRSPDVISCISGILGASLLSFIMCLIALKRIDEFSLTDINKF